MYGSLDPGKLGATSNKRPPPVSPRTRLLGRILSLEVYRHIHSVSPRILVIDQRKCPRRVEHTVYIAVVEQVACPNSQRPLTVRRAYVDIQVDDMRRLDLRSRCVEQASVELLRHIFVLPVDCHF